MSPVFFRILLAFTFLVLIGCGPKTNPARQEELITSDSIAKGAHPSWYSAQSGDYSVPQELERDPLSDRSQDIRTPRTPAPPRAPWNFWRSLTSIVSWTFLSLLLLAIILALLYFFYLSGNTLQYRRKKNRSAIDAHTEAKMSDLPFTLETPKMGLFEEADAARRSKDYDRAIIYLFSYILLELDRVRCVHLQRGKTNGMYLYELRPVPEIRTIVRKMVFAFEWVFFGRHSLSEERFMECWESVEPFQKLLAAFDEERHSHSSRKTIEPIPAEATP